jgi:hypothetical protein
MNSQGRLFRYPEFSSSPVSAPPVCDGPLSTMKEVLNTVHGVATQAATLIAEEMSLRDLRQALALARTAFRISKNAAICCCPLRTYIKAMGGQLSLIAEFPDREPVTLSGLSTMETAPHSPTRTRRRKRTREHAIQS